MGKKTLAKDIADQLRDIILIQKKYLPNEKLPNERLLSEQMGVSRTSMRAAISELVASGVLVVRRGVGTFIADNPGISPDPFGFQLESDKKQLIKDWYKLRMILESEAMELVVENATDEEISRIEQLTIKENSLAQIDDVSFLKVDREFHIALALASHNMVMEKIVPALHEWMYSEFLLDEYNVLPDSLFANAQMNHEKIMMFVKQRDAKGANLAMRYHLLCAIDDLKNTK
jgi:DNA-binding FadR family transcriptional regulator